MTESFDTVVPMGRSNKRTFPASPAEFSMNAWPCKQSSMKCFKSMPSKLTRLPKIPVFSKLPVSDAPLVSLTPSRRSALQNMHLKFAQELQIERRQVTFAAPTSPILEEESSSTEDRINEPPPKRRRFQRRNSKTPAMMFSSISSMVCPDFDDLDDSLTLSSRHTLKSAASESEQWDGGLGVAEELVRQLTLRKAILGKVTGSLT